MNKLKLVRKIFMLREDQAENLRDMSYFRREPQSKIIRDLFDDFYNKPKKETK